ncbi:hypothetical protein BC628DRAFT_1368892 [Trametes gibbosa]|nr:hypothetical protein BC628DRAFT_1368892 [Trametes gibbosa]
MSKSAFAEICRLPKVEGRIKSINFRRTTPGAIFPIVHANKPPRPNQVLDPAHPALTYLPIDFTRAFPWRICDGFKLRTFPHALLQRPSQPHPSPPYEINAGPTRGRRVNMSLLDIAPRNIGGHVVRQEVLRKFKTAISLIVTRGADVEGAEGSEKVVFREDNDPFDWILTDWVYIIRPEERVYIMPYHHLIPALREVMQITVATGRRLEKEWAKMKEIAVRSPEQSDKVFRRVFLPSHLPPSPSEEQKQSSGAFLKALRAVVEPELNPQIACAAPNTETQEQSTLSEMVLRHFKRPREPRAKDHDQQPRGGAEKAQPRLRKTTTREGTKEK